jgi:hypothetical protein
VQDIGRVLVLVGIVAIVAGGVLLLAGRIPGIGRLPGDFVFQRGPVTIYLPIATSVVVSVVITLVLSFFWRR